MRHPISEGGGVSALIWTRLALVMKKGPYAYCQCRSEAHAAERELRASIENFFALGDGSVKTGVRLAGSTDENTLVDWFVGLGLRQVGEVEKLLKFV